MRRSITSTITSSTSHTVRLVGVEGQHTRDIVVDRSRMTCTELGNLTTSFREMLITNNGVSNRPSAAGGAIIRKLGIRC